MESRLNNNSIATLTGLAFKDEERYKKEGGIIPEYDQYYFEMKQGDNTFLVGFKDLLIALKLMEEVGEIPKIDGKWWLQISNLYGEDINMVKYIENNFELGETHESNQIYKA